MNALTETEVRRLTVYKWRYSLESAGFTPEQAARLVFQKWLRASGRYALDTAVA